MQTRHGEKYLLPKESGPDGALIWIPSWTSDRKDAHWRGREGLITDLCRDVAPNSENAAAVICGPPAMIRFTIPLFLNLGFSTENIFTSREARMKCGIGKCGRCNIGHMYVCKDGPVFSKAELDRLPKEGG